MIYWVRQVNWILQAIMMERVFCLDKYSFSKFVQILYSQPY